MKRLITLAIASLSLMGAGVSTASAADVVEPTFDHVKVYLSETVCQEQAQTMLQRGQISDYTCTRVPFAGVDLEVVYNPSHLPTSDPVLIDSGVYVGTYRWGDACTKEAYRLVVLGDITGFSCGRSGVAGNDLMVRWLPGREH